MMCVSFAAVLWVRHTLKIHGLNKGFATAVGVAPASPRVDLCQTRVTRVRTASGVEVFENGLAWTMKKNSNEKKLDPISVEKWFGANCSVLVDDLRQIGSNETQAAKPVATFEFLHGGTESIKQLPSGQFLWKKIAFHSQQLVDALRDLSMLREAGPHGRPRPPVAAPPPPAAESSED